MATTAPLPYDLDPPLGGLRFKECGDEELALLVAEASEAAFAALYERHYQALYRYCRSILRDDVDAQDAFQTAWARALVALRRGQRDAPVRPWLYRIAHNESISLLRRRRRTQPLEAVDQRVGSAEDHALDRERFASLVADLRNLPERSRGALLMRELSGLSHEEIAVALDTSVSTARQCIYEARRELVDLAAGRATPCDDICRRISDGDRRVLRGRRIAAHLRECPSCAAFASTLGMRRDALRALAPWLPAAAAAGVLHSVFRAGWGAGAAGTGAAGAGAAGAGAGGGAAGSGVAGTTGMAATTGVAAGPAAATAGVVTKAVGVPLLGKSLLAVVALAAGVASVTGGGGGRHAVPSPAPAQAAARLIGLAPAGPVSPAHLSLLRHSGPGADHRTVRASHPTVATPGQSAAASHGGARQHGGRHVAAGHSSSVAPGQAKKVTGTPPGQAKKVATAPPGHAAKAASSSAPGQASKVTGASPGQVHKTTTTPPGQAKKTTTTASTPPQGQAPTADGAPGAQAPKVATTPSGQVNTSPTTPPAQGRRPSAVPRPSIDAPGNPGAAQAKLAPSTP